jgi:hypothetical protein
LSVLHLCFVIGLPCSMSWHIVGPVLRPAPAIFPKPAAVKGLL